MKSEKSYIKYIVLLLSLFIILFSVSKLINPSHALDEQSGTDDGLFPLTLKAVYYDSNSSNTIQNNAGNTYANPAWNEPLAGVRFRITEKSMQHDINILTEPTGSDGTVTVMLPRFEDPDATETYAGWAYSIVAETIPEGYNASWDNDYHSELYITYNEAEDDFTACIWGDKSFTCDFIPKKESLYVVKKSGEPTNLYPLTIKKVYYDSQSNKPVYYSSNGKFIIKSWNESLLGVRFRITGKDINGNNINILTDPTGEDGTVTVMLPKQQANDTFCNGNASCAEFAYDILEETIPDGFVSNFESGYQNKIQATFNDEENKFVPCVLGYKDMVCEFISQDEVLFVNAKEGEQDPQPSQKTGSLEIYKSQIPNCSSCWTMYFDIKITLSDKSINGAYGDATFVNGVANAKIKQMGYIKIIGLPAGIEYQIEETNTQGFIANYDLNKNGIIKADEEIFTSIYNDTWDYSKYGHLRIQKKGSSNISSDIEFDVKITLSDTNINGTYRDVTFNNGVAMIKIKKGETKYIDKLPAGITYTVEEVSNSEYKTTYRSATGPILSVSDSNEITTTYSNATGVIIPHLSEEYNSPDNTIVEITNEKNLATIQFYKNYYYPQMSVKYPNINRTAEFEMEFKEPIPDGKYGDMTVTNGKGSFSVQGKGTVYLRHLPIGIQYRIHELNGENYKTLTYVNDYWPTLDPSGTYTVGGEKTYRYTFTNEKMYKVKLNIIKNGKNIEDDKEFPVVMLRMTPEEFYYYGNSMVAIARRGICKYPDAINNSKCYDYLGYNLVDMKLARHVIDLAIGEGTLDNIYQKALGKTYDEVVEFCYDENFNLNNECSVLANNRELVELGISVEDRKNLSKAFMILDGSYYTKVTSNDNTEDVWERQTEYNEFAGIIKKGNNEFGKQLDEMQHGPYYLYELIPENSEYRQVDPIEIDLQELFNFDEVDINLPHGSVVGTINVTLTNERPLGYASINALKKLNDKKPSDGVFEFVLKDSEGKVLQTKVNDEEGNIVFDDIEYTLLTLGTHTYTIEEKQVNKKGFTLDNHTETVTVLVEDVGTAELKVTTTYDSDGAVFNNIYKANGEVSFNAKKEVIGSSLDEVFTFELKDSEGNVLQTKENDSDGNIVFDKITYNESDIDKTYVYTINEVVGTNADYTYDNHIETINVTVNDNGDGTLNPVISSDHERVFINTYKAVATFGLELSKTLENGEIAGGEFAFGLYTSKNKEVQVVSNDKDGIIKFSPINVSKKSLDDELEYIIKEIPQKDKIYDYDNSVKRATITLSKNENDEYVANVEWENSDSIFNNTKKCLVKTCAQNTITRSFLPGFKMQIKSLDGEIIDSWKSNEKYHETILYKGEYILEQTTTPIGYKKGESIQFTACEDEKLCIPCDEDKQTPQKSNAKPKTPITLDRIIVDVEMLVISMLVMGIMIMLIKRTK